MREKFIFQNRHHADAALMVCVDFRFRETYLKAAKEVFGLETFDLWTIPGVAKIFSAPEEENFREIILTKIKKVSIDLHQIKKIILINHADCGAYGGRKYFANSVLEKEAHATDLKKAREILKNNFPDLEINLGYLDILGDEVAVEEIQ